MENTGISKPKPMAKSCTACRMSKIKCVMPEEDGLDCVRCRRLGLKCVFTESKRGRQCVSRDKARLGPSVRALLRATATESDDSSTSSSRTCGRPILGSELPNGEGGYLRGAVGG